MVKITEKDKLLLKIVGENNNLKLRLKIASKDERSIFESSYELLLPLGAEIIDYSNFLSEEELRDFLNLYRTATYIYETKDPKEKRIEANQTLIKMIKDAADVLHHITLPSLGSETFIATKTEIDKKINDLTTGLDYLDMNFSFVDQSIDRIISEQKESEQTEEQKILLVKEFTKLKKLLEFVKEYYEGVLNIIREYFNEYSTDKDIEDIKNKLKSVEKMLLYIESSFNTKRINKIISNNNSLEELLAEQKSTLKK